MGVSTDAILVYGIPLEEGAIRRHHEGEDPETGPAWMAYSGDVEDGVQIVTHCSGDYPMHIVALEGSEIHAHRGYPKRVDRMLAVSTNDDVKLRAFVAKHGLTTEKGAEPGWWLASWWA